MVNLTSTASDKIKELLEQKDGSYGLRVFIKSGGCSGFSYGMALDTQKDNDIMEEQHGVKIFIDSENAKYLTGIEIDFVDDITAAGFKIHNPNDVSSCGCGSPFHTKDEAGHTSSTVR